MVTKSILCIVFQAQSEADADIKKAKVDSASENSTTLIGKDTDLLIHLLYYAEANGNPLYFKLNNQLRGISNMYYINKFMSILNSDLMCTIIINSCIHKM